MPQIAISGTEFRGEHVDRLLRTAERVDADGVEVWYPENFDAAGTGASVARLMAWPGAVVAVSAGVEISETTDVVGSIQRLTEAITIAHQLGADRVNTYFGSPGYRDDRRSGDVFLENIYPGLRLAESLGVMIVLENEFDAFGRDEPHGDLTRRPPALRVGAAGGKARACDSTLTLLTSTAREWSRIRMLTPCWPVK